jgi:hypothetical protein
MAIWPFYPLGRPGTKTTPGEASGKKSPRKAGIFHDRRAVRAEDLLPNAARLERYNLTDSPFNNVMILLYPTSRRST